MNELGNRIKELRTSRDLTMEILVADMNATFPESNLDISMLSRWENGLNEPSLAYVKYMALYFDVSADYIAGLTDRKTPIRLLTR
jgi:transcriptional regulator with XRE-family HTH domain